MKQYVLIYRKTTYYYPTRDEAERMARFLNINVNTIKEVDIW